MRGLLIGLVVVGMLVIGYSYLAKRPAQSPEVQQSDTPEIEVSKSYQSAYFAAISTWILEDEECLEIIPIREIPNHILYDENGQPHSFLDQIEIVHALECHLGNFATAEHEAIELIQGGTFRAADGTVFDGTKQALRAYSMYVAVEHFKSVLSVGRVADIEPVPSSKKDPCEAMIDIALNGSTLELRFAAFYALHYLYPRDTDRLAEAACPHPSSQPERVLVQQTKAGDVEAAINLSKQQSESLQQRLMEAKQLIDAELPVEERIAQTKAVNQSILDEENAKVAAASGQYPLLALAYAAGSSQMQVITLMDRMEEYERLWNEIMERYDFEIPSLQEDQ